MDPLLVFDGDCGFCTRALGWLRVLDRRRIIQTAPLQRPGVPELIGCSQEQCKKALQWRGVEGQRAQGAEAIAAALAVALDSSLPIKVHRRTATAQDRLYDLVARNRHRLPGVTPWCQRYPDDCAGS